MSIALKQILGEFRCIVGDEKVVDSSRKAWVRHILKTIQQARLDRGARVSSVISHLLKDDDTGSIMCSM